MRSVFIHDDDCWQIELLPISTWQFCERELREIQEFLQDNPDDSGVGWREIYTPSPPPFSFADLHLTARSMHALIGRDFIRWNRVTTGYHAQVVPLDGAVAFSFGTASVFFVHQNAQGFVGAVWLEPSVHSEHSEDALAQALGRLGRAHRLLVVDRKHGRLADLSDSVAVGEYIRSRSDHARPIAERIREDPESKARQRPWWKFWG